MRFDWLLGSSLAKPLAHLLLSSPARNPIPALEAGSGSEALCAAFQSPFSTGSYFLYSCFGYAVGLACADAAVMITGMGQVRRSRSRPLENNLLLN